MRRLLLFLLASALCLSLAGSGKKGDAAMVRLDLGASETLSKDEIRAALDAAIFDLETMEIVYERSIPLKRDAAVAHRKYLGQVRSAS